MKSVKSNLILEGSPKCVSNLIFLSPAPNLVFLHVQLI